MGRVAQVLSSERVEEQDATPVVEVKVDAGGGDVRTVQHYAPAGDDALPLPGDFAALERSTGSGTEHATGYHDPKNEGKALPGEKRLYVRDEEGELVAELWLSRTGFSLKSYVTDYPVTIESDGPVWLKSPDVRLTDDAGRAIPRLGDLVAITLPPLTTVSGGFVFPVGPQPSSAPVIRGAGQIVNGSPKAKTG